MMKIEAAALALAWVSLFRAARRPRWALRPLSGRF